MRSALSLGYLDGRRAKGTNSLPTWLFISVVVLLVFSAGAVLFGQATGLGLVKQEAGRPVAVRDVIISRGSGDIVVVTDAVSGEMIASYPQDAGGFVRGSLRAFERMRQVAAMPADAAYRIIKWDTGRISLSDTATGERIYLEAFGRDNAAAFAALLDTQGGTRP
ncbi:photosynthetic complex assembly protein PuhC [Ciceribacter sp. L1K22]|uniref:photosynthetic complex assembly protein PuhC n=1 Tax=Ciceribacter sp. L1K22 TaxID=2820275 RepID=UPI001ABE4DF9|nr:photosynthetic complex assembly protein PuhC [Ciceribacter sp. L1K22]MBO3761741.1 phosphonoacetaldehyde hydrolase [Ciceribacter sp. L1K22]